MDLFVAWEIIINFVFAILTFYLFKNILSCRTLENRTYIFHTIGVLFQAISISAINFCVSPYEFSLFLVTISLFIYALFFFRSSISKKIFISVTVLFSSFLSDFTAGSLRIFFPVLSQADFNELVVLGEIRFYMTLIYILSLSLIYFFIISIKRFINKDILFNWGQTLSVVCVIAVVILSVDQVLALSFDFNKVSEYRNLNISIICISFLLMLLAFILNIWQSGVNKRKAVDYAVLVQKSNLEKENYQSLEKFIEEFKVEKHSYEENLQTLAMLAQSDDKNALIKYCTEFLNYSKSSTLVHFTGNSLLDAVLTTQSAIAKNSEVDLSIQIYSLGTFPVDNYELCSIVGNLLSNAITASIRLEKPSRKISFVMKTVRGMFLIKSINNCDGYYKMIDGKLKSVKKEEGHGFGLHSVKIIAETHGGFFDIQAEDKQFVASVMIPLKSIEVPAWKT